MNLYYQPTKYPTHHLLGLYMPGGNRKNNKKHKLPGMIERDRKLYLIVHDTKNPKKIFLQEIK